MAVADPTIRSRQIRFLKQATNSNYIRIVRATDRVSKSSFGPDSIQQLLRCYDEQLILLKGDRDPGRMSLPLCAADIGPLPPILKGPRLPYYSKVRADP